MLQDREKLVSYLEQTVRAKCLGRKKETDYAQKVAKILYETYNISIIKGSMIVSLKMDLNELSDFELYCVLSILNPGKVKEYYTETEIKTYSESKIQADGIKWPLRIKAIKVDDDQYIGCISASILKSFGDAGLINYNENTQRTMQHIIKGSKEYYRITLNQTAVSNICDLMKSGVYISDDITLNIPDSDDVDFTYDGNAFEIVIKQINAFDIIDGYHRYVAITKLCNLDPEFDYPMEIRITNYPESKAQQFIWQKDQKTRMRKLDSDSLNQELLSNRVISRLNGDSSSVLYHQIDRNGGRIDAGLMSLAIEKVFFAKKPKETERATEVRRVSAVIRNGFENLSDKWLSNKPDLIDLMCLLYVFREGKDCNSVDDLIATTRTAIKKKRPSVDLILRTIGGD